MGTMDALADMLKTFIVFSSDPNLQLVLCAALVGAALGYVLWQRHRHASSAFILDDGVSIDKGKKSSSQSHKDRQYGTWTPVDFSYPEITPCTMELEDIKPVPYRPFRWGTYHVTMGIRSMPWNDWIEIDKQYPRYHRIRSYRLRTRGAKALAFHQAQPGIVGTAYLAAIEHVHEVAEYLCRRYPKIYQVVRHDADGYSALEHASGWGGAPPIKQITVTPLLMTHDLPLLPIGKLAAKQNDDNMKTMAEKAMEIVTQITQDDFALMIEGTDGRYYLQGGAILVPGFWRMTEKLGLPLEEIHLSGDVPQYKEKLQLSMERFFRKLSVDKPVARNNFFVQIVRPADFLKERGEDEQYFVDPEELGWSRTTNGEEDGDRPGRWGAGSEEIDVRAETLRMRSERQTLRRLKRSGAIVFSVRTYMTPVEELVKERGVAGRMASALRGWGEDVARYKGAERYLEKLLTYLDEWTGEGQSVDGYPY